MARVQEGAFDPGPPPPEAPKPPEEAAKPTESFRERCLREIREREASEAKVVDWYRQLASDADPGDAALLTRLRETFPNFREVSGNSPESVSGLCDTAVG